MQRISKSEDQITEKVFLVFWYSGNLPADRADIPVYFVNDIWITVIPRLDRGIQTTGYQVIRIPARRVSAYQQIRSQKETS